MFVLLLVVSSGEADAVVSMSPRVVVGTAGSVPAVVGVSVVATGGTVASTFRAKSLHHWLCTTGGDSTSR